SPMPPVARPPKRTAAAPVPSTTAAATNALHRHLTPLTPPTTPTTPEAQTRTTPDERGQSSADGRRRARLVSLRRRFDSTRRFFAARDGLVGTRGAWTTSAAARRARRRSSASSRFWACER